MGERSYERVGHVEAPPDAVFSVLSDVERWPTWTPTVRSVTRTGSGPLAVGHGARVRQPRLAPATWTVTDVEPGCAFTWSSHAPGLRSVGEHRAEPEGTGTRVTLRIRQDGPLAPLVGRFYGALTLRYLEQELVGLRAHCTGG